MTLYLVQHGDALPKAQNPDRPLSDKGRADIGGMAAFLATGGVRVDRLLHSGKTRARETADLFQVGIRGKVEESPVDIAPNAPTQDLKDLVERSAENLMVVGHLPFMGRMVSHLVTGTPEAQTVTFEPGSVVALERAEDGDWAVSWMVRPSLLAGKDEI